MNKQKTRIVRKYVLPQRPFLHGVSSAFDMFGVLNQGRTEQLLANLHAEFRQADRDIMRSAWQRTGKTLHLAIKQQELLSSGNRRL